jgi:hypothetical protein
MKTFKFACDKVKKSYTTEAECLQDAAYDALHHFAGVIARREFGRKGFCRIWNWISDGRAECFVGTPAEGGGCSGKNVIFDVDLVD